MDLKDYKYRATFTSVAKVIVPSAEDRFIAKASLSNLKGILPAGINPDENPDMLYIAADGAVAGLCNKNDDAISVATALAINGTALHKYISTDHDREKVCGVILHPAFSRFGSNEPLTAEEAARCNEPFNMSIVGALWRVINPMLVKYLHKVGDATDSDALALSWEIAFNSYSIGVGAKNLFDAKLVAADQADYAAYDKLLRANGGTGKDPAGNSIYRVLDGDALILGYSIVPNPAAEVKGILPLEKAEITEEQPADSDASTITTEIVNRLNAADESLRISPRDLAAALSLTSESTEAATHAVETLLAAASEHVVAEKNITLSTTSVTPITTSMKIESLEQLNSQWAEIRKLESAAAVADFIQAIEEGAKKHIENFNAAETRAKQLEETQAAIQKQASELKASLEQVQTELAQVRANAAAAEMQTKFTERMASFDEKYDLDDEDRKLIAEDVIACQTDEAFEAYAKKCAKLLGGKAKKKAAPFVKTDDKSEDKPAKTEKADDDGDGDEGMASVKAAIASVVETPGQTTIPAGVDPIIDDSLKAQMAKAFGGALQINGKPANTELSAK